MRRSVSIAAITFVALLSGCSTYSTARSASSADNVVALRSLNGKAINVGAFTATKSGEKEIMCRGVGPIKTPDGEPFSDFVRKALLDELKLANAYSASGPATITGNLDSIDFSSGSGAWTLGLTVKSSNGKSMRVSEQYAFTTSFNGEPACNQTAQALMPAVQNLVGKIVRAPEFASLMN